MKLEFVKNRIVATAETATESMKLLQLADRETPPATVKTAVAKKDGRRSKFATDEERKKARRKYARRWYKKNKAKREQVDAGVAVPVNIIKEEENNDF